MFKVQLLICLLLFFVAACAPVELDTTDTPIAVEVVEVATETIHEADDQHDEETDDHEDEHHDKETDDHEDEHHDEETDDHEDEHHDEETDEHEDEHEDEHHDEETDDHEDEHRELGAHEHGAAELTIALSGSDVVMALQTPAFNVLGFEYKPASDEEKALLAESIAALERGALFQFNPDAACTLVSAEVEADIAGEGDAEGDAEHDAETHSDIEVSYTLDCEQPDRIASLDAGELFAQFPNFADIQVQWISDTQQSAADLRPDNPVLMFK